MNAFVHALFFLYTLHTPHEVLTLQNPFEVVWQLDGALIQNCDNVIHLRLVTHTTTDEHSTRSGFALVAAVGFGPHVAGCTRGQTFALRRCGRPKPG